MPIHENVAVICDQIANIIKVLPGLNIVLNVSKNFSFWGEGKLGGRLRSDLLLDRLVVSSIRHNRLRSAVDAFFPTTWGIILQRLQGDFRFLEKHFRFGSLLIRVAELTLNRKGAIATTRENRGMEHINPITESWRKRLQVLPHDDHRLGLRPILRDISDPTRQYIRRLSA